MSHSLHLEISRFYCDLSGHWKTINHVRGCSQAPQYVSGGVSIIRPPSSCLIDTVHVGMRQTMSAATESLAQKWLRQNIQAYAFKDAVYAHVDAVLSQFSAIRPKTDVYSRVSILAILSDLN